MLRRCTYDEPATCGVEETSEACGAKTAAQAGASKLANPAPGADLSFALGS